MSDPKNNATEQENEFTLQDVERAYFPPENFAKAQEKIAEIETLNIRIRKNYDGPVPDGYGLLILPISKREKGETVNIGVAVCALPTLDTIAAADGGEDFIQSAVIDKMAVKLSNAVRPKGPDGTISGSMPISIEDFLESRKRSGFKTFTELAPRFVKFLRKKGLKGINPSILRQVLQSTMAAKQYFDTIPQEQWVSLLNSMVQIARKEGLDTTVLENWKETRDQAHKAELPEDIDFGDLAELIEQDASAKQAADTAQ